MKLCVNLQNNPTETHRIWRRGFVDTALSWAQIFRCLEQRGYKTRPSKWRTENDHEPI